MFTTIHLHGRLGKTFGTSYRLDVKTPAEAVRALIHLRKGFEDYLRDSTDRGFGYRVLRGTKELSPMELLTESNETEFHFFPVPLVAGNKGVMQVIIGIVLVVAAVYSGGATLAAGWGNLATTAGWTAGFAGGVGGAMAQFAAYTGAAMIFGGISQLVANPKGFNGGTAADNSRGYIFNGSKMTTRQGGPVPVGYGRLHVGPQVISLGVTTSNEKPGTVVVDDEDDGTVGTDDATGVEAYGASTVVTQAFRSTGKTDWLGTIDHDGRPVLPVTTLG